MDQENIPSVIEAWNKLIDNYYISVSKFMKNGINEDFMDLGSLSSSFVNFITDYLFTSGVFYINVEFSGRIKLASTSYSLLDSELIIHRRNASYIQKKVIEIFLK